MTFTFYNVKTRTKVEVDLKDVKKKTYTSKGQTRYAFRTVVDGVNLTKFVSKKVFMETDIPTEV